MVSRYCHNCGQDLFSGRERSFWEIVYNAFDTIFAFDNKILRTLKYLIFFPGKLSKEYCDGKIIRYVMPSKLFWFITVIFLALFTMTVRIEDKLGEIESEDTEVEVIVNEMLIKESGDTGIEGIFDDFQKEDLVKLLEIFGNYFPYIMFLMVPVFALLLQIFFWKKRRFYANQVVFSLHIHSFLFLLFTILLLLGEIFPNTEFTALWLWIPILYLIVSLYIFYKPKKRWLLLKTAIIMLIYAIALIIVFIFVLGLISFFVFELDKGVEIEKLTTLCL